MGRRATALLMIVEVGGDSDTEVGWEQFGKRVVYIGKW